MPKWMWQNRDEVVAEGWRACERNRPVVVTGAVNKILRSVLAVTPTRLVERQMLKSIAAVRSRGRG